jgi:hypothetical protein
MHVEKARSLVEPKGASHDRSPPKEVDTLLLLGPHPTSGIANSPPRNRLRSYHEASARRCRRVGFGPRTGFGSSVAHLGTGRSTAGACAACPSAS